MLDLQAALDEKQISEPVQRVVLAAAQQTSCQPLDRSRDGHSVPCVAEQGTQVALYPMKHRLAITMAPDKAEHWGARLGAKLEKKSPRTTYLHLKSQQLEQADVAACAVEAAVVALRLCSERPQGLHGDGEAPPLKDFGLCPRHGYEMSARGCPQCNDE